MFFVGICLIPILANIRNVCNFLIPVSIFPLIFRPFFLFPVGYLPYHSDQYALPCSSYSEPTQEEEAALPVAGPFACVFGIVVSIAQSVHVQDGGLHRRIFSKSISSVLLLFHKYAVA
jgi:hypothetical protein